MLAADPVSIFDSKFPKLQALISPNSQVITTITPSAGQQVKSALASKGLWIAGGVGVLGTIAYLLFVPPKKKAAAPSAPISGLFRRRRRRR